MNYWDIGHLVEFHGIQHMQGHIKLLFHGITQNPLPSPCIVQREKIRETIISIHRLISGPTGVPPESEDTAPGQSGQYVETPPDRYRCRSQIP